MGASRKLQGEIDRVLKKVQEGVDVFDSIWNKVYDTDNANQKEKFEADLKKEIKKLQRYRDQIKTWIQSSEIKDKKVSASYEQALVDARKLIEREMERFKICEKETKTKAFSKEGLGQQPKTDPKEKAKSETRDWLNNVVGELESQIDNFEAEVEGLTVKKGKTRPPRLAHLDDSITRHKAHIMKLELILRLLDNDELSPEQVNDAKDFIDDYVERNQEDFDEFSDVDELYNTLQLEKVEALEDLVTMVQPALVKGGGIAGSVMSLKTSVNASSSQAPAAPTSPQLSVSVQEQDETNSQDSNPGTPPKTSPSKSSIVGASNPPNPPASPTAISNSPVHLSALLSAPVAISAPVLSSGTLENAAAPVPSPLSALSVPTEDETMNSPVRISSPALADAAIQAMGIGKGAISGQSSANIPISPVGTVPSSGMTLGALPLASEVQKRVILGSEEGLASSVGTGRPFSSSVVPGMQWRPGSSFQSQNEAGQIRGRTEIAPDQREKFLQRLQQVQQQGNSNILGMPGFTGGNSKHFLGQQNPLLQQLNSQSSSFSSQVGPGMGIQSPVLTPASMQPQISIQQGLLIGGQNDSGPLVSMHNSGDDLAAAEEQQQQSLLNDSAAEITAGPPKNMMNDNDLDAPYAKDVTTGGEKDYDFPLGQSGQASGSLGIIGRRSVSDLGAIGDSVSGTTSSGEVQHDSMYNLQMLEAAYFRLPQPKDSERAKSYTPRNPAPTPSSYPQVQAPIVNHPAFWERLGLDTVGTDTLFFAFYYQQNTYQQYLAAKELKKQSWRYHRKFNTWFQRHEEPKIATDEFEKGTYVYFDFHVGNDELQQGWCQRIKSDFTFEYNYLEDELIV